MSHCIYNDGLMKDQVTLNHNEKVCQSWDFSGWLWENARLGESMISTNVMFFNLDVMNSQSNNSLGKVEATL